MLASCAVSVGLVMNTPLPSAVEFRQVVQAPLAAQRLMADSPGGVFPSFMVASLLDDEAAAYQAKQDAINTQVRAHGSTPVHLHTPHAAWSLCSCTEKGSQGGRGKEGGGGGGQAGEGGGPEG